MIQLPLIPWCPPESRYRDHVNSYALYPSSNDLGIPDLHAETWVPERLVAWHDPHDRGPDAAMHFFLDDYRFERLWANPSRYIDRFEEVGAVLTPDFSTYTDMPLVMQLWQTYRNRWMGAHLQSLGIRVIPTVGWATPAEFFYYGLPHQGVLAVATTGIRRDEETLDHFAVGFERLAELDPTCVLVYGGLDGVFDDPPFPVVEFEAFTWTRFDSKKEARSWVDEGPAPADDTVWGSLPLATSDARPA